MDTNNMRIGLFIIRCKISKFGLQYFLKRMKGMKYLLTVFALLASFTVFSQETKMVKNRKKTLEKQEEAKEKAQEKGHQEGLKRHTKIQTKATQKRMKQTAKKNKRLHKNKAKKEFFLKRWFS